MKTPKPARFAAKPLRRSRSNAASAIAIWQRLRPPVRQRWRPHSLPVAPPLFIAHGNGSWWFSRSAWAGFIIGCKVLARATRLPHSGCASSAACCRKPRTVSSCSVSIISICTNLWACDSSANACFICVRRTRALRPLFFTASPTWRSLPIRCANVRCESEPDDA